MDNRTLVNDIDCEKSVLGAIMNNINCLPEVRDILTLDCFYSEFNRNVFRSILSIEDRGNRADIIAVTVDLKKNGVIFEPFDIVKMSHEAFHPTTIYQHAAHLFDLNVRRNLWYAGQQLVTESLDLTHDIVDVHANISDKLKNMFYNSQDSIKKISDAVQEVYDRMNKNASGNKELTGTPTGFEKFDKRSGGLQKSDLILIAAESSLGKTSLGVSMMRNAALSGAKVVMYSMEMSSAQIATRLMSIESGIPSNEISYSQLREDQYQKIDSTVTNILNMDIYFDEKSNATIESIINSIRSLHSKYEIQGVLVDYAQLISVKSERLTEEAKLATIARQLKNIAKELGIWVVLLSQLNRDKDNPVPSLNRLRGSGQMNEAADVTMLIYRPEYYGKRYPEPFEMEETNGTAMIDVAKGRNIGVFKFILGFEAKTTRFYDRGQFIPNYQQKEEKPLPF